jgi:hypothetical protein
MSYAIGVLVGWIIGRYLFPKSRGADHAQARP